MGKIKRTYDEIFKKKAIDLYFKEDMGYTPHRYQAKLIQRQL